MINLDKIYTGDVLAALATWPTDLCQCAVTSPPYWGLRDYGVKGQLGLEADPRSYVDKMVGIFREVRRVLRSDGTLWLNLGDSYACSSGTLPGDKSDRGPRTSDQKNRRIPRGSGRWGGGNTFVPGLKNKDLMGIPWRVALALQDDGWFLRCDVVWSKPNPMPESVKDRPTRSHEYIFLLSKSEKYFYDAAAIRTPAKYGVPNSPGSIKSPYGQGFTRRAAFPSGWDNGPGAHGSVHRDGRRKALPETQAKLGAVRDKQRGHSRKHAGFNERWDHMPKWEQTSMGRNARSVWEIATQPFPEAHFATFPEDLVARCLAASSRPGDIVLDPFMGAGTTALVAYRGGRHFVGAELNPEYVAIAEKRLAGEMAQMQFTEAV